MARGLTKYPEQGERRKAAAAWVGLGLVLALIGCSGGEPEQRPVATSGPNGVAVPGGAGHSFNRVIAGSPNQQGWYEAVSEEGGFEIWFPAPFSDLSTSGEAEDGTFVYSFVFATQTGSGCSFTASCIVRARGSVPADFADQVAASFAATGMLMSRTPFEAGGVSGLHLAIEQTASLGTVRVFAADGKAFQLIIQCPLEDERMAELSETFFGSFGLLDGGAEVLEILLKILAGLVAVVLIGVVMVPVAAGIFGMLQRKRRSGGDPPDRR